MPSFLDIFVWLINPRNPKWGAFPILRTPSWHQLENESCNCSSQSNNNEKLAKYLVKTGCIQAMPEKATLETCQGCNCSKAQNDALNVCAEMQTLDLCYLSKFTVTRDNSFYQSCYMSFWYQYETIEERWFQRRHCFRYLSLICNQGWRLIIPLSCINTLFMFSIWHLLKSAKEKSVFLHLCWKMQMLTLISYCTALYH